MTATETNQNKAPLLGFVVAESDDEISVRVAGGTWIINRADIESLSDWENAAAVDFDGRPVEVVVSSGADLGFLQTVRVSASDRPMTLPKVFATFVGADRLRELGDMWGSRYDLQVLSVDAGSTPSACDVTLPDAFGLVIQADDCKD